MEKRSPGWLNFGWGPIWGQTSREHGARSTKGEALPRNFEPKARTTIPKTFPSLGVKDGQAKNAAEQTMEARIDEAPQCLPDALTWCKCWGWSRSCIANRRRSGWFGPSQGPGTGGFGSPCGKLKLLWQICVPLCALEGGGEDACENLQQKLCILRTQTLHKPSQTCTLMSPAEAEAFWGDFTWSVRYLWDMASALRRRCQLQRFSWAWRRGVKWRPPP